MSNVFVCVNEAFLNHILLGYHDTFSGSRLISSAAVEVVYRATTVPVFQLPQGGDGGNAFTIHVPSLSLDVYRHTGGERRSRILHDDFQLDFDGSFALYQTEQATHQIRIRVDQGRVSGGRAVLRAMLTTALNRGVIPAIKARLPDIRIPNFQSLLGFDVQVDSLLTTNRLLYLLMTVPDARKPSTPPPIATPGDKPNVFIAATDDAINASQEAFAVKRGIDEDTDFPLPMGVNLGAVGVHLVGYVQADNLRIRVRGGDPSCAVDLSASAGIKMKLKPLGNFDLTLTPSITPPRFGLELMRSRDGQRITAAVQVENGAIVEWSIAGLPGPVKPLLRELLTWVESSMALVYDGVDVALRAAQFPIASLDDFPLPLKFERVDFEGNGVLIRMGVDHRPSVNAP